MTTPMDRIRSILHELLNVTEGAAKPHDRFYVSELVGCLRKAYYDRVKPAKQTTTNVVGVLVGRAIHDRFNIIANKHGCRTEVQVEREVEGVKVVGSVDALCDDVVVELKVGDISVDYDVARMQAAIYAVLTNAREAYVIVVDRQSGITKLERVPLRRNEVERYIRERVKELKAALRRRRPPKPDKRFCRFCPYKWSCNAARK